MYKFVTKLWYRLYVIQNRLGFEEAAFNTYERCIFRWNVEAERHDLNELNQRRKEELA